MPLPGLAGFWGLVPNLGSLPLAAAPRRGVNKESGGWGAADGHSEHTSGLRAACPFWGPTGAPRGHGPTPPGSWDTRHHPTASPCPSSPHPGADPAPWARFIPAPYLQRAHPLLSAGGAQGCIWGQAAPRPPPHSFGNTATPHIPHNPPAAPAWSCATDGAPQSPHPVCAPDATVTRGGAREGAGPRCVRWGWLVQ